MNTKNPVNKKPFRRACLPLALTALLPLSTMAMPAEPLFIEAENYNPGGEGVGYHDLDNRNRGNYDNGRSETVGLSAISATSAERRTSDGPATVSYVAAREWLAYDINVPEAGTYQFEIRSARAPAGESRIHLEVDGVDVSGPLMIASTGEPWRYQTFSFPGIDLPAGAQQLRLVFDSAGTNTNWFRLSLAQPDAPGNTVPTITNPGAQTHTEGSSVNVLIEANDDDGDSLTYSASGLPAQLSMNSGTGRIRGTVTGAGNHPVIITVDDSNGGTATARFDWVVNEPVLNPPPANSVLSVDFERLSRGAYKESDLRADFLVGANGRYRRDPVNGPNRNSVDIVADPANSGRGNVMRVMHPEGNGGGGGEGEGGMRFRANVPPADEYYFAYDFYVPSNWFQPLQHKMPGMINGTLLEASHPANVTPTAPTLPAFSARLQSHSNAAFGRGEGSFAGYFYDKDRVQRYDWLNTVDPESQEDSGQYRIPKGRWVKIEQYIKVNTVNLKDGIQRIWVDGVLLSDKTHRWRADLSYRGNQVDNSRRRIDGIFMTSYYGGNPSDPRNRAPADNFQYYDNFIVSTSPITH